MKWLKEFWKELKREWQLIDIATARNPMTDKKYFSGNPVDYDVQHEETIFHEARKLPNGSMVGEFRHIVYVTIEGETYEQNETYFVELKKSPKQRK